MDTASNLGCFRVLLLVYVVGGNLQKEKGHRRSGMKADLIGLVIVAFFVVVFVLYVGIGGGINDPP